MTNLDVVNLPGVKETKVMIKLSRIKIGNRGNSYRNRVYTGDYTGEDLARNLGAFLNGKIIWWEDDANLYCKMKSNLADGELPGIKTWSITIKDPRADAWDIPAKLIHTKGEYHKQMINAYRSSSLLRISKKELPEGIVPKEVKKIVAEKFFDQVEILPSISTAMEKIEEALTILKAIKG